jgi:hypothetical protein
MTFRSKTITISIIIFDLFLTINKRMEFMFININHDNRYKILIK